MGRTVGYLTLGFLASVLLGVGYRVSTPGIVPIPESSLRRKIPPLLQTPFPSDAARQERFDAIRRALEQKPPRIADALTIARKGPVWSVERGASLACLDGVCAQWRTTTPTTSELLAALELGDRMKDAFATFDAYESWCRFESAAFDQVVTLRTRLKPSERTQLLRWLPESNGYRAGLRTAVQRDYQVRLIDFLAHADRYGYRMNASQPVAYGQYNGWLTRDSAQEVYLSLVENANHPIWDQPVNVDQITESLLSGMWVPADGRLTWLDIWRLNLIANSRGRQMLAGDRPGRVLVASALREVKLNLARAALFGGSTTVLDPMSGKPLKMDATGQIVYSVGLDRVDDGGKIADGSDLGFRR